MKTHLIILAISKDSRKEMVGRRKKSRAPAKIKESKINFG